MDKELSKEKILESLKLIKGFAKKLDVKKAMDIYADQQAKKKAIAFAEFLRINEYHPSDKSDQPNWIQLSSKKGWLQPGKSIVVTEKYLYESEEFKKWEQQNKEK